MNFEESFEKLSGKSGEPTNMIEETLPIEKDIVPLESGEEFDELKRLVRVEEKKKQENKPYNLHLISLNPSKLEKEDFDIYKKFNGGTLTKKEFELWRGSIVKRGKIDDSRSNFFAFLTDQIIDWEFYKQKHKK